MAEKTPDSSSPSSETEGTMPSEIPLALPVHIEPGAEANIPVAMPVPDLPTGEVPVALPVSITTTETPPILEQPAEKKSIICPVCSSPRHGELTYCDDCGYYFTAVDLAGGGDTPASIASAVTTPDIPTERLQDRYEIQGILSERAGVIRYRAVDHQASPPIPVTVLRQTLLTPAATISDNEDEILPSFDMDLSGGSVSTLPQSPEDIANQATISIPHAPWPGILWEQQTLAMLQHPAIPRSLDRFQKDNDEYLVVESPQGTVLWDAWDDPDSEWEQKFGYLVQIAEVLSHLHMKSLIFESLRPELWVIDEHNQVRLTDIGELLPLPLPADAPIRGRLYTAPEVLALNSRIDTRADLFGFGAMLYALHVGREPTERDFARQGDPKPFIPQFPDIHPAFGRLMSRTFRREVGSRFPSDEASRTDPTGIQELIHTLKALQRTFDTVRLEIASWTTTGMVRTGNEDAFALLHATEARQDDLGEQALIILCDGMGGYEAGEVAAALAIQVLRRELLQHAPFRAVAGKSPFPVEPLDPVPEGGYAPPKLEVAQVKEIIKNALREANKAIYSASRAPGSKRAGMGCTAEVVFLDGRQLIVGHVGDSRTYHLNEGRLNQVTRDQTLVNRLIELGQLTEEEAENHPRRNELQQALGGRPEVEPALYSSTLHPGDWVLVCSDGVTNHIKPSELKEMLQSEASSAEVAARRLVNLTNIEGATDNATVVVVRCT